MFIWTSFYLFKDKKTLLYIYSIFKCTGTAFVLLILTKYFPISTLRFFTLHNPRQTFDVPYYSPSRKLQYPRAQSPNTIVVAYFFLLHYTPAPRPDESAILARHRSATRPEKPRSHNAGPPRKDYGIWFLHRCWTGKLALSLSLFLARSRPPRNFSTDTMSPLGGGRASTASKG